MIEMTSGPAIEVSNLEKHFGSTRAVDRIDMRVERGTVYGLLGPNGAGKTTVVRMLAALLKPDGGWARVLGYDVQNDADAVRSRISLTGQFASVDEDLTGRENLTLRARLLGLSRAESRSRSATLLVTAVRGLMDGASSLPEILRALVAGSVFIVIFGPTTMFLYGWKH